MSGYRVGLPALLWAFWLAAVPAAAEVGFGPAPAGDGFSHSLTIPQFSGAAKLGTDLSKAPWNTSARVTGFLRLSGRQLADHPTFVYACYDRTALWLAYRCEGIDGRKAKVDARERDGRVWWDDGVEFYCSPDLSRRHFTQFAANAAGVAYDGKDTNGSWDAKWQVASAVDATGFTIAMRIPFSQLKVRVPQPGEHWRVNFSRHGPASGSSTWAWCYNAMHDVRQFGKLVFGGPACTAVRMSGQQPWSIGRNTIEIDDTSGIACRVVGADRSGATILESDVRQQNGKFAFAIEDDAVRSVQLLMYGDDGQLLAATWSDVRTPELRPRLARWQERFEAMGRVSSRWPQGIAAEAGKLLAAGKPAFAEAQRFAGDRARHSADTWARIEAVLDDLDRKLGDLAAYAATLEHFPRAEFAVGLESPMRRVMIRDFPFDGRVEREARVQLAANEHEGLQVVVIPFRRDLENVTVKASVAASNAAGSPPKISCAVSLVAHVDVNDDPPYEELYKGFWPDPLLSFLQSAPVKAGEHVAFWLDVAVAKGAPAGEYKGRIEVAADGCNPVVLPLTVEVWGFELPDGTHLRNAFTYHENQIKGIHRGKWGPRMEEAYRSLVLDHRLGIDHLYRGEPPDLETLKWAVAKGMNAFNIICTGSSGGMKDRVIQALNEFVPRIRKAGLFDLAYVYGFDEIRGDKFGDAREVFDAVHRLCPGLPTMTTAQDISFGKDTGLRDAVDIWVPLTPSYDVLEAEELRREGKQMWWYVCLVPIHPYANWFVEYPAIESRLLMGAMSRKYRVDGFLYYLINNGWERNRQVIASGPYSDWDPASCENSKHKWANGDGNLIYPGPDGPLSSIRLENIRDGLEDYEYLHLLAEQARRIEAMPAGQARDRFLDAARPLLAVPDTVVRSVVEYTLEPGQVARWREEMAKLIVAGEALGRPR